MLRCLRIHLKCKTEASEREKKAFAHIVEMKTEKQNEKDTLEKKDRLRTTTVDNCDASKWNFINCKASSMLHSLEDKLAYIFGQWVYFVSIRDSEQHQNISLAIYHFIGMMDGLNQKNWTSSICTNWQFFFHFREKKFNYLAAQSFTSTNCLTHSQQDIIAYHAQNEGKK